MKIRNPKSEVRNCFLAACFLFIASTSSFALGLPSFYGDEIVVTASRMPELRMFSPFNVEVIKKEEMKGKNNLGEALREAAGIDVKASGFLGSVASARVRGATSQQVLVLLNGRRLNSPLIGMVDLSDILLDDVDRIEVVKTPLSSLYGSDAIGGVINIITKKEGSRYEYSYGSYNTKKYELALGGFSLCLLGSDGFRQNSDYNAQKVSQNLDLGETVLGAANLDLTYYNSEKGVPGVPNSDPYSASTPGDRQKDQNLFASLVFESGGGNDKTRERVYYDTYDQKTHLYDFFNSVFVDSQYKSGQAGLEYDRSLDLSSDLNFVYGGEAREDYGLSTYAGNHRINNYAVYGQGQWSRDRYNLAAGIRFDQHSLFGCVGSPRVGIEVALLDGLKLRSSLSSGYKAPTLNDLYYQDNVYLMYGNPALSPERSRTFELGLEKALGENGLLAVNGYSSLTQNLVQWEFDPLTYITMAKNVGEAAVEGGEATLKYSITPRLKASFNYTVEKAEDRKDVTPANVGKRLPYSPEQKYNLSLMFAENARITLSHVGERYGNAANTVKLAEYTTVSLWAGREFGKYQLSLEIDNIFNEVYYETSGFNPVTYANASYPMPGRRVTVSLGGKL